MRAIGLTLAIAAGLLTAACQGSRIVPHEAAAPALARAPMARAADPLALPGSLARRLGQGERGTAGPQLLNADNAIGRVLDAQARRPAAGTGMCPRVTVETDTCVQGPRSQNALWLEQYWRKARETEAPSSKK